MLMELQALKRINISNNQGLSSESLTEIVGAFKAMNQLQEIELSKLNCNSVEVFRELADLIIQNRRLKSIIMQRSGVTDALASYLAEPLVRAQQMETLKFDYNELTGTFLEKYCRKMAMIGFSAALHGPNAPGAGIDRNASASLLASESEDALTGRVSEPPAAGGPSGLIALSLEGNDIGDRGAEAIATMIQKESDATRSLKTINLNECGIGNAGFQKLKKALGMRGSLTKSCNLTHIGIKVERNLFDM